MAFRDDEIRYDSVEWAGVTVAYSWCHSRRRTLGITVRPDKSVSVRVPLRTPAKEIRAFVTHRAEWVLKVWKKLDAGPGRHQQCYCSGALFMYQGKALRLEFEQDESRSLCLRDRLLVLTAPETPAEETVRTMVDAWYRKQAAVIVRERSLECHRMMSGEGIPLPPITIRAMKTRWGSYSYRTGRITLNLNLVKAPPECLDYVIIHELCHIKVRHHGPDFWRMVGLYAPDYPSLRRQLQQYI
ncbi:MAG TPA: SprT family zinc-dependent metalloprotease [Dongiaceae bacterium]|nr:SprT family zinc-dependent metalloprotease [Dongiaceae bacterium]